MKFDESILEILVCPLSRGKLEYDPVGQVLISRDAGLAYPICDGIPILLPDEAHPIQTVDETQPGACVKEHG